MGQLQSFRRNPGKVYADEKIYVFNLWMDL